jgi:hypothetical protein
MSSKEAMVYDGRASATTLPLRQRSKEATEHSFRRGGGLPNRKVKNSRQARHVGNKFGRESQRSRLARSAEVDALYNRRRRAVPNLTTFAMACC